MRSAVAFSLAFTAQRALLSELAAVHGFLAGRTRGGPDAGSDTTPLARLRGFHPAWFGAVMGTAIVGVAASLNPGGITSLAPTARALSQAMVVLAAVLAVVLAVPYAGRWIAHRDAVVKMAAAGTAVFGPLGPAVALASRLAATALWGFGVWWLAAAVLLLVHYLRSGPLAAMGEVPPAIEKAAAADARMVAEQARSSAFAMPPGDGALDPETRTLIYLAVALATSNRGCTIAMVNKARTQAIAAPKLLEAVHIARFALATQVVGNAEPVFDLVNERAAAPGPR